MYFLAKICTGHQKTRFIKNHKLGPVYQTDLIQWIRLDTNFLDFLAAIVCLEFQGS